MSAAGVKSKLDDRENYTPGWKYNHWEVKGVPLRVEFGARDLEAGGCVVVRRDTGAKETVALGDLATRVPAILEEMQAEMFARAKAKRDAMLRRANEIKVARESGKEVRARADATMLADIDAEIEEKPDETVEIPDNKVKLVIGAGGENIRRIQKKSGCRLQVKKKKHRS